MVTNSELDIHKGKKLETNGATIESLSRSRLKSWGLSLLSFGGAVGSEIGALHMSSQSLETAGGVALLVGLLSFAVGFIQSDNLSAIKTYHKSLKQSQQNPQ